MKAWERYEGAAKKVLEDLRNVIGVSRVEGKQDVLGSSGTTWEIDARAWNEAGTAFLLVEVRRYTKQGLPQEALGAVAYRVQDIGANGGVVISPLPLQQGAALVAKAAGIHHVKLAADSSSEDYLAEFMGKVFHGASVNEAAAASDATDATVVRSGKTEP